MMDARIGLLITAVMVILVCFVLPFLIKQGCRLLGLPKIPAEFCAERAQVVCTSVSDTYAFVMMLSAVVAIFLAYATVALMMEREVVALMMFVFMLAFAALAVTFFMIMKNRMVLLFADKLIFRDAFGKVFCYSSQQVIGYAKIGMGVKSVIQVRTIDKKIYIEAKGTNFRDAQVFVMVNYRAL